MRHTKADSSAPVKARTAFGQWFLDGPKTCVHSRGPFRFVPILVPRARRFLVTWSYGTGMRFWPFWSGIGYGFRGNYGSVWTYLSFQFKMSKKSLRKKEKCNMRILNRFLERFCLRSNLSNNDIISAQRPGLKKDLVWKRVWKMTFFGLI